MIWESAEQTALAGELQPETARAIGVLQRLAELFAERRCQLAKEVGLTVEQWRVLEEISDEHFMPSMFAKARDCSAAAVSKVLRQLSDRGLIEASIDGAAGADARRRQYRLTAEGQKTMKRLRESREHAIEAIWGGLDFSELHQFVQFGSALASRMQDYAENER